jgi:hypothetical protein
LNARESVATDTPLSFASSLIVVIRSAPSGNASGATLRVPSRVCQDVENLCVRQGRHLDDDERAILDALLAVDFPGAAALRAQARAVRVAGRACGCGCPSITLTVPRGAPKAHVVGRVPVSASGRDGSGTHVGVLLHVVDGELHEIEAYDVEGSGAPAYGWPLLETLRAGPDEA